MPRLRRASRSPARICGRTPVQRRSRPSKLRRSWRKPRGDVTELRLAPIVEDAYEAQFTIQDYENIRALAFEYERHRDRIDPLLRVQLQRASAISADEYDAARRIASRARRVLPTP